MIVGLLGLLVLLKLISGIVFIIGRLLTSIIAQGIFVELIGLFRLLICLFLGPYRAPTHLLQAHSSVSGRRGGRVFACIFVGRLFFVHVLVFLF